MLLDRHSLAARYACSKEEHRGSIRNVLVTTRETVGTDGHMLAVISHPSEPLRDVDFPTVPGFSPDDSIGPVAPVLIPADTLERVAKSLPKKQTHAILEHALLDPVKRTIATTDLANPSLVSFPADESRFPDYAKIIDRDLAGRVNVLLSIPLLERALKIAKEGSGNGQKVASVVLSIKEHQGAVILQAGRAFILVMPLRGDEGGPTVTLPGSVPVTIAREDVEAPKVSYNLSSPEGRAAAQAACDHFYRGATCTKCGLERPGNLCQTCGDLCEGWSSVVCNPCAAREREEDIARIKADREAEELLRTAIEANPNTTSGTLAEAVKTKPRISAAEFAAARDARAKMEATIAEMEADGIN